jgi:uncharacterized protein YegP (UPF0339 family)
MAEKRAKWQYWQSEADGHWYFNLRGKNGKIVLQSEGYEREKGCLKGIAAIINNAQTYIVRLD